VLYHHRDAQRQCIVSRMLKRLVAACLWFVDDNFSFF
jgi:hypothetical protein